jgi:hypothetical protein
VGEVFVGDAEENGEPDDSDAEFVPGNAWDAWMLQAVKSVVRARFVAKVMRYVAYAAAGFGVLGVAAAYWLYVFSKSFDGSASRWDRFLSASPTAASVGIAACTAVAVLLGGSALVDLYAQRLDLSIIEADDEGDIE